jgi:hypothetical protein
MLHSWTGRWLPGVRYPLTDNASLAQAKNLKKIKFSVDIPSLSMIIMLPVLELYAWSYNHFDRLYQGSNSNTNIEEPCERPTLILLAFIVPIYVRFSGSIRAVMPHKLICGLAMLGI